MDRKYLFDFIILFSDLLLKLVYHYARTTYSMCDLYREVKMPKPKVSGSKNKKSRKSRKFEENRDLIFKEHGQEYARVTKMLGCRWLAAECFDGVSRLCHIGGKLQNKIQIKKGDMILIALREYQDCNADVVIKYNPYEEWKLKEYGELPDNAGDVGTLSSKKNDCEIVFGELGETVARQS